MIYKVIISESYSVGIEADELNVNCDVEGAVTFYKYFKSDYKNFESETYVPERDIIAIFNLADIIGFFIEKGDNEE